MADDYESDAGNPSLSGTTLTGLRGAAAGTDMIGLGITGDANDRFVIDADGTLRWGAPALDSSLSRTGDSIFRFSSGAAGYSQIELGSSTVRVLGWNNSGSILTLESGTFQFTLGTNTNRMRGTLGVAASSFEVVLAASHSADAFKILASDGTTKLFAVNPAGLLTWAAAGNEQTTVGAAGGASALPATPTKFLKVKDSAGTTLVIPAYAAA